MAEAKEENKSSRECLREPESRSLKWPPRAAEQSLEAFFLLLFSREKFNIISL